MIPCILSGYTFSAILCPRFFAVAVMEVALEPAMMDTTRCDRITIVHDNRCGKREKWNARRLGDKSDVSLPAGLGKATECIGDFRSKFQWSSFSRWSEWGRGREKASRIDRYWQQVDSTYGTHRTYTMYLVRRFVLRHSSPFPGASYENLIRRQHDGDTRNVDRSQEFAVEASLLVSREIWPRDSLTKYCDVTT